MIVPNQLCICQGSKLNGTASAKAIDVTLSWSHPAAVAAACSNSSCCQLILLLLLLLLLLQVRGFFRGLSSPLIGGAAETGVNYLVYSRVLDMFKQQQQQQQQQQSLLPAVVQQMRVLEQQQHQQQLIQQPERQHSSSSNSSEQCLPPLGAVPVAGAVAGVALSVILAPTELIKCRMQVRPTPVSTMSHCYSAF
jgi:hypothetical protein